MTLSSVSIGNLLIEECIDGPAHRGAMFSPDRAFRYALWRRWGGGSRDLRWFVVIGLNPSTADAERDDPTIRRCVQFAKREHCHGLVMLNLFAFRATSPHEMLDQGERAIGEENDRLLRCYTHTRLGAILVAAWGDLGGAMDRDRAVRELVGRDRLRCFGHTHSGNPRHPLRIRGDTALVAERPASARVISAFLERGYQPAAAGEVAHR